MPDDATYVISSAVVAALPGRQSEVVAALSALPDTVVAAAGSNNKIVVLLEGRSRGDVGARLAQIALIGGVVAANMVFEHVE
jgi:nitrate reductase NapD